MRPNARRAAATVILATTALTGISVAPGSARVPPQTDGAAAGSVVVLGDSVAAGEGARDGYRYRDRVLLPGWTTTGRTASTTGATRSAIPRWHAKPQWIPSGFISTAGSSNESRVTG